MEGRHFLSRLNRYLLRKPPEKQCNRSALTTRLPFHGLTERGRFETIGDVAQKPPFNRTEFDRLISEQGLTSPRAVASENRQVRDKSYYMGLLHRKGYEVRSEIQKLLQECEKLTARQSVHAVCKTTAESRAYELRDLQGVFWDYNSLDDLCNRNVSLDEAEDECRRLKSKNALAAAEVEEIFKCVRNKSSLIEESETDLAQEAHVSDILGSTSRDERCLRRLDCQLKSALTQQEQELSRLLGDAENLEIRCKELGRGNAILLIRELSGQERKRDALLREHCGSFEEGYFRQRKKEHADLINCMRKQTRDVRIRIDNLAGKVESNEFLNQRACNLSKLQDREKVMDIFLESYPTQKLHRRHNCEDLERVVLSYLCKISLRLSFGAPGSDAKNIDGTEERRLVESMKHELLSLLEKESLEDKLLEEIANLKKEMLEKRKEIAVFSNIESLEASAEGKKRKLMDELSRVKRQRDCQKSVLKELEEHYGELKEKMRGCRISADLERLEKRWHDLENENFLLGEGLAVSKLRDDYSVLKSDAMDTLRNLNEGLLNAHHVY